jgi:hypothetical protein
MCMSLALLSQSVWRSEQIYNTENTCTSCIQARPALRKYCVTVFIDGAYHVGAKPAHTHSTSRQYGHLLTPAGDVFYTFDQSGQKRICTRDKGEWLSCEHQASILNKGRPNGADDSFLKISRDNDGLKECILSVDW